MFGKHINIDSIFSTFLCVTFTCVNTEADDIAARETRAITIAEVMPPEANIILAILAVSSHFFNLL